MTIIDIGKHKGETVEEVMFRDMGYFQWIIDLEEC
jgi:hypothetical protein